MRDYLHMVIYDYSCRCGNRWTHSTLRYDTGGTPTPLDEDKLQVQSRSYLPLNTSHCFRCVSLAEGEGWIKPAETLKSVEQSIEDQMLS